MEIDTFSEKKSFKIFRNRKAKLFSAFCVFVPPEKSKNLLQDFSLSSNSKFREHEKKFVLKFKRYKTKVKNLNVPQTKRSLDL